MDDFYVTIPYGLVVLGGGIAGYVKRGSAASLAAGAGFGGALLLAGALSIWAFARHSSSLFATVLETARGCRSLPRGRKVKGEEADATVRRSGKRGFAETIDLKLKLEPALAATLAVGDEEVADGVIAAEPVSSPGG